jgi:hypothetical protein
MTDHNRFSFATRLQSIGNAANVKAGSALWLIKPYPKTTSMYLNPESARFPVIDERRRFHSL